MPNSFMTMVREIPGSHTVPSRAYGNIRISGNRKIIGLLLLLMAGATAVRAQNADPPVQHLVLVWLKEPGNLEHRQQLIETSLSFTEIPGVQAVSAGEPLPGDRAVVDDSFDVAVVITFENVEAMRRYENHPMHLKAVNEVLRPLAGRMVVYDFAER